MRALLVDEISALVGAWFHLWASSLQGKELHALSHSALHGKVFSCPCRLKMILYACIRTHMWIVYEAQVYIAVRGYCYRHPFPSNAEDEYFVYIWVLLRPHQIICSTKHRRIKKKYIISSFPVINNINSSVFSKKWPLYDDSQVSQTT